MADDVLKEAQEAFALCQDRERDNRAKAEEDIRFARLEEQWPTGVQQQREREGRPCLTINKLAPVIRQVVNDSRQNKPQIKVMPQDSGSDPETAEVMSGLIRNIEASSDADVAYDTAVEAAVCGGLGYFRIGLEYAHDDTFEQDLVVQRISDPFSVYMDPYSTAADSSDWNLAFVSEMIPKAEFKRRYKTDAIDWDGFRELPADWSEGEQVRLAEYWTREEVSRKIVLLTNGQVVPLKEFEARLDEYQAMGITVQGAPRDARSYKVTQRLLSGAEIIEETDWLGKFIPIVPVIGDEVVIGGKRHFRSLIRSAKDAQRMFNYWRSQATEMVALAPKAPFIGPKGAFDSDAENWSTANTVSHPFLEYDGPVAPARQPFASVAAGALQEAMNAADDIKATTGIYDASLGARSNETSGRAIIARQREGDVSTFHFIDNLARAIRHGGRILIDMIPHVYSAERVVRVLGEDGEPKAVPVNQPIQVRGPQGEPQVRTFDLTAGKYDLTVSAGPSFTTRREEAAEQMMELMRVMPAAAPVIGDLLAKNLDWPGADEIGDRLKAMLPPQAAGQNPQLMAAQQQMQQMQQQGQMMQAELTAMKADNALKQAEIQLKAKEIGIKEFEAQSERMKIQAEIAQMAHDAMNPQPISDGFQQ